MNDAHPDSPDLDEDTPADGTPVPPPSYDDAEEKTQEMSREDLQQIFGEVAQNQGSNEG